MSFFSKKREICALLKGRRPIMRVVEEWSEATPFLISCIIFALIFSCAAASLKGAEKSVNCLG